MRLLFLRMPLGEVEPRLIQSEAFRHVPKHRELPLSQKQSYALPVPTATRTPLRYTSLFGDAVSPAYRYRQRRGGE